jgi:ankyrin repeat protein
LEGKTPLIFAAQYGRKETVSLFIAKGIDLNISSGIEEVSALMMASKEGHKGIYLCDYLIIYLIV